MRYALWLFQLFIVFTIGLVLFFARTVADPVQTIRSGGLLIEEYRTVNTYPGTGRGIAFRRTVMRTPRRQTVRQRTKPWWFSTEDANRELCRTGYRLVDVSERRCDLYYRGRMALQNIGRIETLATNESGDRCALVVRYPESYLIHDGTMEELHHETPKIAFAGDDLLLLQIMHIGTGRIKPGFCATDYEIRRDGRAIYRFTSEEFNPGDSARVFTSSGHRWILEYDNNLVADGVNVGRRMGYDKVFCYYRIAGRDFFFAEKAGKVRICHDGRLLPNPYDEVVHYQCCEPGIYNPGGDERGVGFYARRGDMWYRVEVSPVEESVGTM